MKTTLNFTIILLTLTFFIACGGDDMEGNSLLPGISTNTEAGYSAYQLKSKL